MTRRSAALTALVLAGAAALAACGSGSAAPGPSQHGPTTTVPYSAISYAAAYYGVTPQGVTIDSKAYLRWTRSDAGTSGTLEVGPQSVVTRTGLSAGTYQVTVLFTSTTEFTLTIAGHGVDEQAPGQVQSNGVSVSFPAIAGAEALSVRFDSVT